MNLDKVKDYELRLLVAEHVMGLKILTKEKMLEEAQRVWETQPKVEHFFGGFRAWREEPDGVVHVQQVLPTWDLDEKTCMLMLNTVDTWMIKRHGHYTHCRYEVTVTKDLPQARHVYAMDPECWMRAACRACLRLCIKDNPND